MNWERMCNIVILFLLIISAFFNFMFLSDGCVFYKVKYVEKEVVKEVEKDLVSFNSSTILLIDENENEKVYMVIERK